MTVKSLVKIFLIGIVVSYGPLSPNLWAMGKGRVSIRAAENNDPKGRDSFQEFEKNCFDLRAQVQARVDHFASLNSLLVTQFMTETSIERHYASSLHHVSGEDCILVVRSRDIRVLIRKRTSQLFRSELDCQTLYSENAQEQDKIVFQRFVHDPAVFGTGTRGCRVRWIELVANAK